MMTARYTTIIHLEITTQICHGCESEANLFFFRSISLHTPSDIVDVDEYEMI